MTPTETVTPSPTISPTPEGPQMYTVEEGDNCWDVAVNNLKSELMFFWQLTGLRWIIVMNTRTGSYYSRSQYEITYGNTDCA